MLKFFGLGLENEYDLTLKEIEELKKCDEIYIDLYTSISNLNLENLKKIVGKEIKIANREFLESEKILEIAKNKNVGLIVIGDCFFATTHLSLLIEARKRNVEVKTFHNASIISAISKFVSTNKIGQIISIPLKSKIEKPFSVYEVIKENKKRNLHTLLLLDIDIEKNEFLSPSDALKILLEIENEKKENIINIEDEILILERIGWENENAYYGKIKCFLDKEFKNFPYSIIYLAKLNKIEEENLLFYKVMC